ncbi:TIGR04206 family protein [Haloarchaeobius sp. HRN-SO-5]|uniref:TIGR04206 family protein n=1 Tax=Haloarchaeobius sp. HRN-SO-5 TaxID=3446118 RepID=UPI003EBFA882
MGDRRNPDATATRRLLALVVVALSPFALVRSNGVVTAVFPAALVDFDPPGATLLTDYLFRYTAGFFGLPPFLQAWPLATLALAGALASAAVGARWGVEDVRVTGGLLLLSALSSLRLVVGILSRPGQTAVPVAAVVAVVVLWWYYWPLVGFE